jgi:FkbM family methyltransferase
MKIVFITPNLSTGGMPEYVRRSIELLNREQNTVLLIEMRTEYVLNAIRQRVLDLTGIELFSAEKSSIKAVQKIKDFNPDIIHFTEPSEQVINPDYLSEIYVENRTWKIIETCHDSSYPLQSKQFLPDKFLLVSPFQVRMMQSLQIPSELIQYDVPELDKIDKDFLIKKLNLDPNKKHIFQFGIFSPRKNQKETVEIAKLMINDPVQFHFVGNTADSYSYYWKPILDNLPKNCKFWGEHKDVQQFYSVADMVIFPSIELIDDKETNPLVIKETIKYKIPLFLKDTPVYLGMYPENSRVTYMKSTYYDNYVLIQQILKLKQKENMIKLFFNKEDNKLEIWSEQAIGKKIISVKDIDSEATIYSFDVDFSTPEQTWWCRPIPIEHYDFYNEPTFTGFLVEVWSEDKTHIIEKETISFKESQVKRKIPGLDDFEPIFVNYDQFFVKKIYDNLFAGERMNKIIDIGANVGLFTQWALDRFGKDSSILAFEPNPIAIQAFKKIHGHNENIFLIESAVADKEGDIYLGIDPNNSTTSSIYKKENQISIKAVTLADSMKQHGWLSADLLKIDIEGCEYDVINAMTEFPFKHLLIEFHDNVGQLDKVLQKLKNEGYHLEIRKEDTRFRGSSTDYKGLIIAHK